MYTPIQLKDDQSSITMIGIKSTQIKYNASLSQWINQDSNSKVTAMTEATQLSYDKKSDEGSNSVRMRYENSGASTVVEN